MSKPGRFLLDTNIVISFLANEPSVAKSLGTADEVFIPVVVMGELFYGVSKSRSVKKNLRILEELVTRLIPAH
jgi:tRNA(fMet)-specific endonuclease VapC